MTYIPERDTLNLGLIAIGGRVLFAIAIDLPGLLNSGWITALTTCAITLPLAFCLRYLYYKWKVPPAEKMVGWAPRAFTMALCLFSLYDTGCSLRLFILSAQHTALESINPWILIPMLAAATALCCMSGPQAVGGAARASTRFILVMLVIIVGVQFSSFNMRWLAPVLGPGVPALVRPVPHLAGMMTNLVPLWLLKSSSEQNADLYSMPVLTGYIAIMLAILLACLSMLTPLLTGVPDTRIFTFDRMLTNGRVAISLQLVLLLCWHACMMISLTFSLTCATRMLQLTVPKVKWHWAVAACALVALTVPALSLGGREVIDLVNQVRWPVITLPILGAALVQLIKSRKEAKP